MENMEVNDTGELVDIPGKSGDIGKVSSVIKAMDKTSVHRLCSGQVVLSMAIAVKELVENALDAGATNIEVRLQEYGSKVIEVIDNGKGVTEDNFQALTLKHHTSKISGFEDVSFVSTFGFRGEALSSLCAVSKMTVTTRDSSKEAGNKISYDHNGKIVSKETCSRSIGTTVKLSDLFCTMPVRLKEFQRNLKREFNKMIHNLHSYCLISTGTRITCINTTEKGKKSTIVSTGGHNEQSQICEIFGASQNSSLQKILWKDRKPFDDILTDFYLTERNCSNFFTMYTLAGFISSCEHGKGRTTPDRQFFYINNRPCDMPKVSKLVNEIYHQFNRHQYPFVFLNIKSDTLQNVDINVTPDKRMIFVENEKLLFATIKSCLIELFQNIPSSFKLSSILPVPKPDYSTRENFNNIETSWEKRENTMIEGNEGSDKRKISFLNLRSEFGGNLNNSTIKNETTHRVKRTKRDSTAIDRGQPSISNLWKVTNISVDKIQNLNVETSKNDSSISKLDYKVNLKCESDTTIQMTDDKLLDNSYSIIHNDSSVETLTQSPSNDKQTVDKDTKIIVADDEDISENTKKKRTETVVNFSIEALQNRYKSKKNENKEKTYGISTRFKATIHPEDNSCAEAELRKEINKQDFLKMKIFGQFNRGFIIAALEDDVFIIDQHASDEKVFSIHY